MKDYFRAITGARGQYAEQCFNEGFIGADYGIDDNLFDTPAGFDAFNAKVSGIYLKIHPEKTKIAAGLAAGVLFKVRHGMKTGDIILASDGQGSYRLGEVTDDYEYRPDKPLPHRRPVHWFALNIPRLELSEPLRGSANATTAIIRLNDHAAEIESLLGNKEAPKLISTDSTIENPVNFALEAHLEHFLVENWSQTTLADRYEIYSEDGEMSGQQYGTETGAIDILAISKDKKELLVIELKKGRASDNVVGQIQRYMGYVQEELAEAGQTVRGIIIALEDDAKIRYALKVANNIDFYTYQVSFKLNKVEG